MELVKVEIYRNDKTNVLPALPYSASTHTPWLHRPDLYIPAIPFSDLFGSETISSAKLHDNPVT